MKKLILAALPMAALATNHPQPPPKTDPSVKVDVHSTSVSGAKSQAKSKSKSASKSASSSQSASTATGGKSNAHSSSESGDSSAAVGDIAPVQDQNLAVSSDDDTLVEGQRVPAQFLPMILESGCRTGVNAGGADRTGSGALGFSVMTDRCWSMTSVVNFLAMGEYETACDLLVDVNRDQFHRIGHKPDCQAIAQRLRDGDKLKFENSKISVTDHLDTSQFVTRQDLAERDKRQAQRLGK